MEARNYSLKFKAMKLSLLAPFFILLLANTVHAHCPLCTLGAAAVAGGALWLGVKIVVIGIFIGAFASSMGYWISRLIKRKFIPLQSMLIIAFSFITTVWPLKAVISNEHAVYPIYVSLIGEYGSLLNRTYLLDHFVAGSAIGGLVVILAPWISKKISHLRGGKIIPYQGVAITLSLLIITGIIVQVVM